MKNLTALLCLLLPIVGFGQGEADVLAKIIDEGKNRNQTLRTLEHICVQFGPRLTGSSNLTRACNWAADNFRRLGLENVHLQQWGEIPVGFRRGERQIGRMVAPEFRNFQFTTRSWTAGTAGLVRAPAVLMPTDAATVTSNANQYRGKWVVDLRRAQNQQPNQQARNAMTAALREVGAAGQVWGSQDELVRTSGSWSGLSWDNLPTDVIVTVRRSDHEAILANLNANKEVVLEFELENIFEPGPVPVYNVVADIVGTEKPDEIVIVSGHLDSWDGPGSMGTCDNGTGSSVTIEAARILMAAGAKPKRTIRFILWTGEEQGLHGSRWYVQNRRDELPKIQAVLVDDSGTNYNSVLSGLESMRPQLEQAIQGLNEAFPDMPTSVRVVQSMRGGGGSDHAPFVQNGVPGFFWGKQGVMNYQYIWHTQHDTLAGAVNSYLIKSSTAMAYVAYNLACAPELLPRIPTGD
ncbi:MAG: M20/M25/M40 family metallo-hydrolase [Fimbriimonadales bacterium]|nr:M20/M25/M40 family metallo-hydrolase [Fimbriimonadales bacterium]